MAQQDVHAMTGATYTGVESTYGTTPSVTRTFVRSGGTISLAQTIIGVDTMQNKLVRRDKSTRGYKSCSASFTCDAYIDNTRLTSATSASTTWLGALLKAALGGESAAAGSTFAAGSSASSIVAATGHGARFPVGTVFLADVGDVPEVVISKSVSTDTITPLINLSASPTTGQDLINCHCYYLTDTNTQSVTLQHALAQDSSHQWTLNGCAITGLTIDLSRDAHVAFGFSLSGSAHTGPSSQSISTAVGTNSLVGPIDNVGAICASVALDDDACARSVSLAVRLDRARQLAGAGAWRLDARRGRHDAQRDVDGERSAHDAQRSRAVHRVGQ